jgi:predicted metal-dependent hydrolase
MNDHPAVIPRRVEFDLARVPKYWHSGSPFLSHFFTALSIVFPEGEKFFIDSVRHYEAQIEDSRTRAEVKAFIAQEAHHGYQHRLYNEWIESHDVHAQRVDALVGKVLRFLRKVFTPMSQLAITIALEHFTAVLANQALTNPKVRDGIHPDMKPLWTWHAMEETEHKAVCYDVYEQVGGGYWRRVFIMSRVMIGFPIGQLCLTFYLLGCDGFKIFNIADIARGLRFLYGQGGFIRSGFPELRAYFRRDFHPWNSDNRELIAEWHEEYGDHVATSAGAS